MKLTSKNVEEIFMNCLAGDEKIPNTLIVEGITCSFGFDPQKIDKHKDDIYSMLKELPESFQVDGGGGMSFLNACDTKDGKQWTGLHQIMDNLFCLGIAIEKVGLCMPRAMWAALPGGMPYYMVK